MEVIGWIVVLIACGLLGYQVFDLIRAIKRKFKKKGGANDKQDKNEP